VDYRIKKHAEVLMRYSLNIKKGEKLLIQGDMSSLPLLKECYRQALELSAFPQVRITSDELREVMLKNGSIEQIQFVPDNMYKLIETIDAYLSFWSETNTRMLTNVPPEKLKLEAQGTGRFKNIMFEREAKGELRWCGTLFPTSSSAQEANMSLSEYEDFVYGAGYLDTDDPIARWREIEQEQEKLCKILNTKKELRIVSRDTDLRLSVSGRRWANCCGHVNFPDGEVFTAPVEDKVDGHIQFSFPGIFGGREIEGIHLSFENGKVTKATAVKGEELLHQLLETDAGARHVGEIAVGTNHSIQRFTRNMLFDEKIGGTVHLAIGRSFAETLGKNLSAIHWDMLCDMKDGGEIYADGGLIYKAGRFLI